MICFLSRSLAFTIYYVAKVDQIISVSFARTHVHFNRCQKQFTCNWLV